MIIYHNPRCSKSREAMELLKENNCDFEVREYLKVPPTEKELKDLIKKLGCKPFDIVRQKEELFINKYRSKKISGPQWIKILAANPILIERPIVITNTEAIVGRPPVLVLELAKKNKNTKT